MPRRSTCCARPSPRTKGLRANVTRFADDAGRASEFVLWNDPGDDLFGAFARCERIVGAMEQLLGGEVYHYHTKLNMKRPRVGGAWNWHQDYGYWYNNGCLFPDMATVAIAVHPATRENGCLQVLRGSHKMGRIDHGRVGGQTGADLDRVNEAMAVLERVYVELEPGDVVFFHCNMLHGSDMNTSNQPRHQLTCCYNRASNNPIKAHHHPRYTPLEIVPDGRIKAPGPDPGRPRPHVLRAGRGRDGRGRSGRRGTRSFVRTEPQIPVLCDLAPLATRRRRTKRVVAGVNAVVQPFRHVGLDVADAIFSGPPCRAPRYRPRGPCSGRLKPEGATRANGCPVATRR